MTRPALLALALLLAAPRLQAAPALDRNGVSVEVTVRETETAALEVVAKFTPRTQAEPLHLYSKDLKAGGVGFPTKLELAPGSEFKLEGALEADQAPHDVEGVSVYPPGPVTLRQKIVPAEADADIGPDSPVPLLLTYMACTEKSCLVPVIKAPVTITLAGQLITNAAPAVATPVDEPSADRTLVKAVADEVERRLEETRSGAIRWRRPGTVAEVEKLLQEAHDAGRIALLDFTGPSCVNCQQMAKTVFQLPEVRAAWNQGLPIEVDTDPPHDALAKWQQERFLTQNRPLYVAISPDGKTEKWNEVFAPDDRASVARLTAFLRGGTGSGEGTGDGGLWSFLLLAVLGGLFTLVMPCTYPMIPYTINAFAAEAEAGRPTVRLAAVYGLGIVAAFTGLGVLITGVFGASLASLSGHPVTNLVIGASFVLLGLSLLDLFTLRLPGDAATRADGAQRSTSGYARMLVMGLTFAITGFTCTAPFAGSVLAQGVATGRWLMPIVGMVVYSGTIALPFFAMGVAPSVLKERLPKAGSWMHEFKVVGALIELGAAAKFLAITDAAWGWGFVRRGPVLALWAGLAIVMAAYLGGFVRFEEDKKVPHITATRLLVVVAMLTLAFWLLHGLSGGHLGVVESFFPADAAPSSG